MHLQVVQLKNKKRKKEKTTGTMEVQTVILVSV